MTADDTLASGFDGACFCGDVTYQVVGPAMFAYHCHCSDCRRINGTAFHTGIAVKRDVFRHSTGALSAFVTKADSGNTITRWACPRCATSLWSVTTADETMMSIKAGTVTSIPHDQIHPKLQIFYQSRVPWANAPSDLITYSHGMRGQTPITP
ncbi:MAG: GFA family protein [Devosia sp.]